MKTKEQKIALVEETAAFFNLDNRCVDKWGGCYYYAENKAGCAVGRLIKDKELCKKLDSFGLVNNNPHSDSGVSNPNVFDALPNDLKEYGQQFLRNLQVLHDSQSNWTETGLSSEGEVEVEEIKAKIQIGII